MTQRSTTLPELQVVHHGEAVPSSWRLSVFLAGPAPRSAEVASWRPEALALLCQAGFAGVVFVPEPADGRSIPSYLEQVEWERQALHLADRILFWIPRDMVTLPGLTTNVEFGRWCTSGKVLLGYPPTAQKIKYLAWLAKIEGVPIYHALADVVRAAISGHETLPVRRDGERHVPAHIWQTSVFQDWYGGQRQAGQHLDTARLHWYCGEPLAFMLEASVRPSVNGPASVHWICSHPRTPGRSSS
jgi:hypothetical protein